MGIHTKMVRNFAVMCAIFKVDDLNTMLITSWFSLASS
jgi:hypothetical protein